MNKFMQGQLLVLWICCFSCSSSAQEAILSKGVSINWENRSMVLVIFIQVKKLTILSDL